MNEINWIGVDPGAVGGDQTAMAFMVRDGKAYIAHSFIAFGRARQTGKSELQRWLRMWRRGKYFQRIGAEKAMYGKRLPARPRPSKLRHYRKLERYGMRALSGRG